MKAMTVSMVAPSGKRPGLASKAREISLRVRRATRALPRAGSAPRWGGGRLGRTGAAATTAGGRAGSDWIRHRRRRRTLAGDADLGAGAVVEPIPPGQAVLGHPVRVDWAGWVLGRAFPAGGRSVGGQSEGAGVRVEQALYVGLEESSHLLCPSERRQRCACPPDLRERSVLPAGAGEAHGRDGRAADEQKLARLVPAVRPGLVSPGAGVSREGSS